MFKLTKPALTILLCTTFLLGGCKKDSPDETALTPETPVLTGQGDFMIVFIPDTQSYVAWKKQIFKEQTEWLARNKTELNILFVAHEGDIVKSYATDESEWATALDCFNDLDTANMNYAVVPGNHDYLQGTRNSDIFNQHFPLTKFQAMPTYGGAFEEGKTDNTYHLISTPEADIAMLMLEFGPRNAVIDWANSVITQHPDHLFIIVTHAYLNEQDQMLGASTPHSATNGYGLGTDANNGEVMWSKLIQQHANIGFVFSGHVGSDTDGAGILVSNGQSGNPVYQIMANYQYFPLDNSGQLRILEFDVESEQITMSTYSPWTDEYLTDASSQTVINDLNFIK